MSILVYLEQSDGSIKSSSLEAVSYAKALAEIGGGTVTAVALGTMDTAVLAHVGSAGAEKVIHIADEKLTGNIQAQARAVAAVYDKIGAKTLIFSKSSLGDAVAARLAIVLNAALVSNVVDVPDLSSGFKVKRSIYTGKAFAETVLLTDNKILSIKKNAVDLRRDGGEASVESFEVALSEEDFNVKIAATDKVEGDVLLPEADIVVSGGRGMKGPEHWPLLEDLAQSLGAALGCSKPVSDLGWRPHHEHVGQTGIKVSPSLYIAVGISGAIQHLAGVNGSRVIVVINKDPEAPFFKAADYGIVGDAFDVLPKLTEAVRALKK